MRSGEATVGAADLECEIRILCQLMHVDHVRDAAQPVQHAQRSPPLESVFERHEEQQNEREQDDFVRRRLNALQGVRNPPNPFPATGTNCAIAQTTMAATAMSATPIRPRSHQSGLCELPQHFLVRLRKLHELARDATPDPNRETAPLSVVSAG